MGREEGREGEEKPRNGVLPLVTYKVPNFVDSIISLQQSNIFKIYFYLCICECWGGDMCVCLQESAKARRCQMTWNWSYPGGKLSDMGVGKQSQVLYKSSKHS